MNPHKSFAGRMVIILSGGTKCWRLCLPGKGKLPKISYFGNFLNFCPLQKNAFPPSIPPHKKKKKKEKENCGAATGRFRHSWYSVVKCYLILSICYTILEMWSNFMSYIYMQMHVQIYQKTCDLSVFATHKKCLMSNTVKYSGI